MDLKNLGFVSVHYFFKLIKEYNKKYLYECIGDAWDAMWNHGIKGKILAPFAYHEQKMIAKNADFVLYVTDSFLQTRYPSKSPSIGVSDVDIPGTKTKNLSERLERINNNRGTITIGTTAGIDVPYKGQKYVIKALGYLKKHGIDQFEYQMVGGGNPEKLRRIAIQEDVEEKVKFLGPKSHDGVIEWLSTIDLYVQPSLQEGLPRALIEAMSMALPAIGSRTGGIPELLLEDCIFEKKNYKMIANMLLSYTDKTKMEKEAERNIEFANKKFDKERTDKKRSAFYKHFNRTCERKQ